MARKWKPRVGSWVWSKWHGEPRMVQKAGRFDGKIDFVDGDLYLKVCGVWTNISWFRPLTKKERKSAGPLSAQR